MTARIALSKLLLVSIILVAGLVLFLSRPAAQTNGFPIDLVLRDAKIIANLMGNASFVVDDETVDGGALIRFYNLRRSRLAWSGSPRALANATIAMRALSKADEHGLDSKQFHLPKLADTNMSLRGEDAAQHDLLLTDAILKYARQLRNGHPDRDNDIDLPAESFDTVSALDAELEKGRLAEFLADLVPPHPEYKRLAAALSRYRKVANDGGWPPIPSGVESEVLRQRLAYEDTAVIADTNVVDALRRYQRRNGLEPDGKLGPQTHAALNISTSDRVDQIKANMERWRWLPRQLEARRVMVDAGDATLAVVEGDQVTLRSRVIVGTPDKPTPIFRAIATGVTVNPPWNVPASIARNEFLPRLRKDPNFLRSQNIVILNGPADDPHGTRIDWTRVSPETFSYRLQQRPGDGNALGQFKFEMPNGFSVYLHDTPGKREFSRSERTLSHGCVRVEKILPLASVALGGDAIETAKQLTGAAMTGETNYLAFERPVPIYVLYWTATAETDGTVQFRRDVYGRDRSPIGALQNNSTTAAFVTGVCERYTG